MATTINWAAKWDYNYFSSLTSIDTEVVEELRQYINAIYQGTCMEVILYLTMAQEAYKGNYPEIADTLIRYANELAEYAGICAYFLGTDAGISKTLVANVKNEVANAEGSCQGLFNASKIAKQNNLDALHDFLHCAARNRSECGMALEGQIGQAMGLTELWKGAGSTGKKTLTQPITDFRFLLLQASYISLIYSSIKSLVGLSAETMELGPIVYFGEFNLGDHSIPPTGETLPIVEVCCQGRELDIWHGYADTEFVLYGIK